MKMLEVKNLVKTFGNTRAVDNISFTAYEGSVFGLVGRNGAGKTSTIRTIMDIYLPDGGEVLLNSRPRGPDFRSQVGYLPEERGLYKFMSIMDNLLFLAEIKGRPPNSVRAKAKQYLDRFDLGNSARVTIDSLSKGNQQKVQFIGAILHDPELLILDEPFSGLDPVNTNLFKDVIEELKRAGKIVLLSTHMMDLAERLCDHVALIHQGKLVLNAPISEIKRQYSQSMVNLQADGDLSFISDLPYVLTVNSFGNSVSVEVTSDGAIQDLLYALVAKRVAVRKFQSNEMSLHDIFVSLTRTPGEEALACQHAETVNSNGFVEVIP